MSTRRKVCHLRSAPPFQHTTLCGLNADSSRIAVPSAGFDAAAFDNSGGLACRNCLRLRTKPEFPAAHPNAAPATPELVPWDVTK